MPSPNPRQPWTKRSKQRDEPSAELGSAGEGVSRRSHDDLASHMSRFDVRDGGRSLTQRKGAVDDRFDLARLDQSANDVEVVVVEPGNEREDLLAHPRKQHRQNDAAE